ncbi:hypothetical protein [Bradyrhizobium sp.]|uniref:hypothetical protein n=1 Tax=Bradyrhizobium sp. TaxID=376 RepID=UPI003C5B3FCA
MKFSPRQLVNLLASVLLACSLAGCASINEKLSASMGDYVPKWAGGLPADAPPRPGTAKYDEYMKERERLRQLPADQRGDQPATSSSSSSSGPASSTGPVQSSALNPVH